MAYTNFLVVILYSSIIIVNGQLNCSTYNPCRPYGYCTNNDDGEWTCKCKFWWNGTTCNQLTNSGTQVIVLGCLLGVLIVIFYGLNIIRYIRLRRRKPKEIKKKEITKDPTLFDVALKTARQSTRLSSFIVAFLMIIATGAALTAKWSIIQPIHNEIVNKFLTNQSLYYDPNPICKIMHLQEFNVITFPAACLLILIFIIRTKRTSFLRDKCHGYGAPPMPADFLSHIDRKFSAVVFAIMADELFSIMVGGFSLRSGSSGGQGVIVVYLIRLFRVFIMGFRYYPFLAAVYINSILTLTCATLYAWLDYSITIINQGMCKSDFYPTRSDFESNSSSSIGLKFGYYGTGPNLILIQLCTDIPRFLCLAYISVKIPMLLIRKIRNRFRKDISVEKRMLMKLTRDERIFLRISHPNSLQMLYVRNLFRSADQRPRSHAILARLIPKFIYEWRDDFRFSTRVLCVYSTIFLLLYIVTIKACVSIIPRLYSWQKDIQSFVDMISPVLLRALGADDSYDDGESPVTSNFPVPQLVRPYLFAVFLTLFIIVIQLLVLLANIRRNLFQSFRGDDCEIPRRVRSKYVSYSSGNVHFGGFFLGYLIWGFILIAVFSAILCICVDAFINFGNVRLLEIILKAIIPGLLFVYFKQYLNRFLAQYVFLQHHGEVLSLNNRRVLMIFIYFNFFLDAILGLISSIMRLVKSFVAGIIYMCRLDYSPFGRKLETFDGGFRAYCGFIHTECVHRHPVLLVFFSHLYSQLKMKQLMMDKIDTKDSSIGDKYMIKVNVSSKYVRKWKLAVFLIRNPTIVFFRKTLLNQLHIDEIRALNDVDDDGKQNMQKRLSVYTRRMSAIYPNIVSDDAFKHFNERF